MPRVDQPFALDGYVLTDLIGFGATGEVWRGRDETTHEPVALKRLWEPAAGGVVPRLRQDAAVVHETVGLHAIRVLEIATLSGGEAVIVMELADGGSLASLLARRGRLHPSEVVTVLAPLAEALAALHARGMVHGDLTPSNVLFTADGRPMLADVGLSQLVGEAPGDDIGFRDPAGDAVSPPTAAADCFALAAIGYAALTGVPPRSAARPGVVEPIVGRAPWVPAPLGSAIEAALAPDPAMRPDVAGFGAAVLAACGAAPVRLTGPRRTPDASGAAATNDVPPQRRTRAGVVIGMIAAVMAIAALVGIVSARVNPPHASALQPAPATSYPELQPTGAPTVTQWMGVIGKLDQLRAQAYRTGDPSLLRQIYRAWALGSAVDRYELALMKKEGLRARGFTESALSVKPQYELPNLADLRVVDHVSAYELVDRAGRVLARRSARTHAYVLELIYRGHRWWVRSVTDPSFGSASWQVRNRWRNSQIRIPRIGGR